MTIHTRQELEKCIAVGVDCDDSSVRYLAAEELRNLLTLGEIQRVVEDLQDWYLDMIVNCEVGTTAFARLQEGVAVTSRLWQLLTLEASTPAAERKQDQKPQPKQLTCERCGTVYDEVFPPATWECCVCGHTVKDKGDSDGS